MVANQKGAVTTSPTTDRPSVPAGDALTGGTDRPVVSTIATWRLARPGFWPSLDLRGLWAHRELLYFLTWRNVMVRYKQAVIGVAWAVLQPLITMVVFGFVFNRVVHVSSGGAPYPLFAFAGLLPWQLFASGVQSGGTSIVADRNLITKVYFPRLVIPASSVLAGLVDFVIAFGVLIGLMVYFHYAPTRNVVWLPAFLLFALATTFAFTLWLSAANVLYRDVQYIIPFMIQIWMFVSPVAYSPSAVSGKLAFIYGLNPMAGVIEGFRWALLGQKPPGELMWASVAMVVVLLVTGFVYFKRMERTFGDLV